MFPADNVWNTPVDQLPVSSYSATWVGTIGSAAPLHPDFGTVYGMPFITVPGTQTKYPATFQYSGESDPGPYAIPLDAPIEGGSAGTGDRHVIAIDTDNCILYEMWAAYPQASSWSAGSGAIFNLTSNALRPSGWTSADAAGLPVFPGLVRYDEVASGQINHALRFTVPQTQNTFIWPARHAASNLTGYQYPPMGARFRLRADFDISGFSPVNQVILTALKKYGMIIADNGSSWFVQGVTDPRWSDDDLHALTQVPGSAFEAVDESGIMVSPDSGQTTTGTPAVTVSLNPASATIATGGTVQFTAIVSNAATQSVTWSVNGVAGGNSVVGTIGPNGLYTAPATVPNGGVVTISATSTAATNVSASATVTVNAPAVQAPVLSSISPSSGTAGTSVTATLNGSNFLPGATVSISGGSGVTVAGVSLVSASQAEVVLSIDASASAGTYGVSVTTSAGTSSAAGFTVIAPAVSTQTSDPTQSTTTTPTTTDTTSTPTSTTTQSDPTQSTSTTTTQPTEVVVVPVPVAVAPTTTDPTQSAPAPSAWQPAQSTQPNQAAPSITSLSPGSVVAGNTVTVTIYGANFTSDATVTVQGLRIITRNVVVVDSNTITAEIVTSAHTPPGSDPLTVKTSAGTSNAFGFTIE